MSFDKHHHATPAKPFTPTLSSAFKSPKSPLTPRLAGSVTPNSSNTLRRGGSAESSSPSLSSRNNELSTPVSAFLNSNVTPRSGSRKARVDSPSSTPSGTPIATPTQSNANSSFLSTGRSSDQSSKWSGAGITTRNEKIGNRPQSSLVNTNEKSHDGRQDLADTRQGAQDHIPLFFHADDAKSAASGQESNVKPVLRGRPATFFYANGVKENSAGPPRTSSTSPQDEISTKAVQPTSLTRLKSPTRALSPPKSPMPNRPPSPLKDPQPAQLTISHNRANSRPSVKLQGPPAQKESARSSQHLERHSRRSSNASRRVSHTKSASVGSMSPTSASTKISPRESSGSATGNNVLQTTLSASPLPSPRTADSGSRGDVHSPSTPLSPTKSSESSSNANVPSQAELAASARRERKVLDLEISNSSLLAINRTLEREMRKQHAELRRYRRLSRSGRLSVAAGTSSRVVSGLTTLSEQEVDDPSSLFNPSPPSPTISEFSLDLSVDSSDDDSSFLADDSNLSPAAQAAHDARHRRKDEARLMLDLSKHQQLLIDSQKMNQSIRRCLGWTEELIREGKKALEYHVRVSDIELGGRVLVPDEVAGTANVKEDEEDTITGGRLLSPGVEIEQVMWSDRSLGVLDGVGKLSDSSITGLTAESDMGPANPARKTSTRGSSPFISTPIDATSPETASPLGETW